MEYWKKIQCNSFGKLNSIGVTFNASTYFEYREGEDLVIANYRDDNGRYYAVPRSLSIRETTLEIFLEEVKRKNHE